MINQDKPTNIKDLLVYKNDLYHLGNLNISERSGTSLEGNALSVSPCPEAWAKIHRISSNQVHSIKPAYFIDMFKTRDSIFESEAIKFCVDKEFVTVSKKYLLSWFDDELDSEVTAIFDTKEEATIESEFIESKTVPIDTFNPTKKCLSFLNKNTFFVPLLMILC